MYVIVAGGGKVGLNLTRELMAKGHEVTLIENNRRRYTILEPQLEHVVHLGDSTELWVLERAGIERADMVIAVTGDDEDNIIIAQVAREKYGRDKIIARCNNIRNMEHFDLLNISPVISSTDLILRLIEHEVPQYGLVHLLKLQAEDLEIIEVEVGIGSIAAGKTVGEIDLPEGGLIIAILREGEGIVPGGDTMINTGDEVMLILNPGLEDDITRLFTASEESFA
ncbi:MAG: TrkA family potassium uptake protein [Solirubrobacterales bacterium]|nr:TrkA family potassium uptake protein [Solirubrobacterales bacterium]